MPVFILEKARIYSEHSSRYWGISKGNQKKGINSMSLTAQNMKKKCNEILFLQVSKYLKIPYKICTELNGKRAGGTLNATVFWLVVAVTIAGKCLVMTTKCHSKRVYNSVYNNVMTLFYTILLKLIFKLVYLVKHF